MRVTFATVHDARNMLVDNMASDPRVEFVLSLVSVSRIRGGYAARPSQNSLIRVQLARQARPRFNPVSDRFTWCEHETVSGAADI